MTTTQPTALPELPDDELRKAIDALRDPNTVSAFHNGYYTLTPDELRRAILAVRPAQQATPEPVDPNHCDVCGAQPANRRTTPEPVGEVVAYREKLTGRLCETEDTHRRKFPMCYEPLYTRPAPAPQQVPMTPEQIVEAEQRSYVDGRRPVHTTDCWGDEKTEYEPTKYFNMFMFARAVEAHHGITAQAKGGAK